MNKLHYTSDTSDLYRQAFQYAKSVDLDVHLFTSAMFVMMRDRTWESGWVDQVHGHLVSAPSLKECIERAVPGGIGRTIEWTYAILKTARDLDYKDADTALELLNTQIEFEEGETAEAIYLRKVARTAPKLSEP